MSPETYEKIALWSEVLGAIAFFVVTIWLWRRYITPAVIAATQRKNAELRDEERKRDEARDQVEVARAGLEEAKAQVTSILERARLDGQRERDRILAEARIDAERIVHNANGELGRGRVAAREQFRDDLLRRALEIVNERARKEIDSETNYKVVQRALDSLDSTTAGASP
ncbi:MAG: ATP synthase F0 subunit B [Candidatus Eremiobacteraeota bacterium]|nr:ATP synthase F0 subunit B [Candidatus Eremiobacteraeota bacterium]